MPLVVLVYLLFSGYTPLYAGTIGLAFIVFLILGAPIAGTLSKYKRVMFWVLLGLVSASFFEMGIKVIVILISVLVAINFVLKAEEKHYFLAEMHLQKVVKLLYQLELLVQLWGL